jgi:hypothetical protein
MAEFDPVQVNFFQTSSTGIITLVDVKNSTVEGLIKAVDEKELLGLLLYNGIQFERQGE